MKLRSALVGASLLVLPAAAFAQPVDGLYVGAGAGYNYVFNQSVTRATGPNGVTVNTNNLNLTSPGGIMFVGSVGYGFGNGFRLEVEGDYRNTHQKLSGGPGSGNSIGGLQSVLNQTYGAMANALFDFDVGVPYVFPYVGVGVGYEQTELSNSKLTSIQGGAAVQGIVGAAFPIPDVPGLSITAEARYMAQFQNGNFSKNGVAVHVGDQENLAGLLGVRYAFGIEAPPPPPAPAPVAAPAPAPARTYLVFFDWDKSDLSARAKQIIAEAAANAPKVKVTRIEVNGYTDTSGSPGYNLKLSVRRAEAVKAELIKDGVPAGEIVTQGFGDTHLLVPTAAGVREPQNRRVEIILK